MQFYRPTFQQFVGCLLGLAIGDAFGSPFEGMPGEAIYRQFGPMQRAIREMEFEELTYTDDTQMAIAVAETLLENHRIEEETLAASFARNFEARRGYGQSARRLLQLMQSGGDWQSLRYTLLPGGSLGNGAAMRVAPVALLFHSDLDRVADEARLSAMPTHVHPIGIDGARILALAIALVLRAPNFDRVAYFAELSQRATTDEFRHQLAIAAQLGTDDFLGILGCSLEAHRSVITAIACFAADPDSYEAVLARAVSLGGDTDTIAAMAGAISGARLGTAAIPPRLLALLENVGKGRDYIEGLAFGLWERSAGQ